MNARGLSLTSIVTCNLSFLSKLPQNSTGPSIANIASSDVYRVMRKERRYLSNGHEKKILTERVLRVSFCTNCRNVSSQWYLYQVSMTLAPCLFRLYITIFSLSTLSIGAGLAFAGVLAWSEPFVSDRLRVSCKCSRFRLWGTFWTCSSNVLLPAGDTNGVELPETRDEEAVGKGLRVDWCGCCCCCFAVVVVWIESWSLSESVSSSSVSG